MQRLSPWRQTGARGSGTRNPADDEKLSSAPGHARLPNPTDSQAARRTRTERPGTGRPAVLREEALVDALAQASFATISALTRLTAEHDLSLTQLRVLGILRDRTVQMSDLATYFALEKSSLSGLIDRVEQRGLEARVRSE